MSSVANKSLKEDGKVGKIVLRIHNPVSKDVSPQHEGDSFSGHKSEIKRDKDAYGGSSSQFGVEDLNEQHQMNQHADWCGGSIDRQGGSAEAANRGLHTELRNLAEVAVENIVGVSSGENKGLQIESGKGKVASHYKNGISMPGLKKKDDGMWENDDREARDGKNERDADLESGGSDKRGKFQVKEPEKSGIKSKGGSKREAGTLTVGVPKGKRLPRSMPRKIITNIRPHSNDNEGSHGEVVDAADAYEKGEYIQEMIKLWTKHKQSQTDKALESSLESLTLEIRIPAKHVLYSNHRVCKMQLWGIDVYTVDSDIVAVLIHTGYCRPITSPPPEVQEFCATVRVLPSRVGYGSTWRNGVRSRAWAAAAVCSFRVEKCCILKKGGGIVEIKPCQTHVKMMAIEPTFAPAADCTMTTGDAAKNAISDQRWLGEVRTMLNLCNEPWPKYSINAVADKGHIAPLFTSARLKQGEVLYLESTFCRYELCFSGEKELGERMDTDGEINPVNVFRWSRVKRPIPQKLMPICGIPLPPGKVEVVADGVEWDDIKWSPTGVLIAGKEYHLLRSMFLSA